MDRQSAVRVHRVLPVPVAHQLCTTGGCTQGQYLAQERKPGGKQVCLTTHSTVPSIVRRTLVKFASWFRNRCCKLRNQHRGARPHSHTVAEQVKAGHTWTKGRVHLASRRKNRRDLDTQGLPDGCKTLGRGREKTDRTGEIRGRTLSLLRTGVLCSQHTWVRCCSMDGVMLFLMRSLVAYPHGMLAERDRLRKQEERKVSLVFGLK